MWFAALSGYRSEPWFGNFMLRLLQGSPDVTRLLAKKPFPGPPKYVRAQVYDYSFTEQPRGARPAIGGRRASRFIFAEIPEDGAGSGA